MKFAHKIITTAALVTMTAAGAAHADDPTQWTGRVMDPTGGLPATTFTLQVDPAAQGNPGLLQVLKEQGKAAFEDQIEDMDQGWLKIGHGLATPIAAARIVDTDQGQVVQAVLDRPMAIGEVANNTRTTDYPFTVLQVEIDDNGKGRGHMMAAADLEINDNGELEVEHMGPRPWQLTNVKTR